MVHEREAIFLNGDRFILIDFLISKPDGTRIAIEIDGGIHSGQARYDRERDQWLEQTHGIRTIRFRNEDVINGSEEIKQFTEILVKE